MCQDLLEYKKKHRVLRVKMLDGSVKTLMVDDSHTVAQLMFTVCVKIGLSYSIDIDSIYLFQGKIGLSVCQPIFHHVWSSVLNRAVKLTS